MAESSELLGMFAPSGHFGTDWPSQPVLTQGINGSLSDAGWKEGAEGFPQQTFLGASIRNFSLSAGFGDSVSTLSVDLVNDEFNFSDRTLLGSGDDPYHNGDADHFRPPIVGTPVYFKFGGNPATIEQAWRKTFDDTYGHSTLGAPSDFPEVTTNGEIERVPGEYHYLREITNKGESNQKNTWVNKSALWNNDTVWRGKDHLSFGGILQSYTQNRGPGGAPLYSLQVKDPREILSNATVLLNNYAGTTFNNKNLLNVFGFLEHDPSEPLVTALNQASLSKNPVGKIVDPATGKFGFVGDDNYHFPPANYAGTFFSADSSSALKDTLGNKFPITGQGFDRRSERGMPWYRVKDGLAALMNYNGFLPTEYEQAGYGGPIDFRGYKYVVDFGGIPTDLIPPAYFLEFDQIDLLALAQELCDIISHDLFVTLLPVINHPACKTLYDYNSQIINTYPEKRSQMIAGIIRVDAIDKRRPPTYGAIKSYLDFLAQSNVEVKNQDLGYELSNVTTDKFVVGGQETNMYYFTANKDRNDVELRKQKNGHRNRLNKLERDKWSLETMLKQQVLPFYGFLGSEKAVTIPKGFGSYQQILLDSTGLNAYGVGNYYVATEIELRAALVSYEQWENFLLQYDEQWMKRLDGPQKLFDSHIPADVLTEIEDLGLGTELTEMLKVVYDGKYGVSVPRCVWRSDKNYLGKDGYPASPCAPPFGYPLYYKRAEKIGVARAGMAGVVGAQTALTSNLERLKDKLDTNGPYFDMIKEDALIEIKKIEKSINKKWIQFKRAYSNDILAKATFAATHANLYLALSEAKRYVKDIEEQLKDADAADKLLIAEIKDTIGNNKKLIKNVSRLAKEGQANARKVYDFVKKVASENLGKKFLVKIPNKTNLKFQNEVEYYRGNYDSIKAGPFGFKPLPITATNAFYATGTEWSATIRSLSSSVTFRDSFEHYLDYEKRFGDANFKYGYGNGALKVNFNPFADKWEYNYKPEPQGGFVDHNLRGFQSAGWRAGQKARSKKSFPRDIRDALSPIDPTNMMTAANRMSCYVRFDNSHLYDFSKISAESLSQQSINKYGFIIPDALEDLDNVNPDKSLTMAQIQTKLADDKLLDRQDPSIAFVRCSVDEEFYMPPQVIDVPTKVFARGFKTVVPIPRMEIINRTLEDDPDTPENEAGCVVPSGVIRKVLPVFSPADGKKNKRVNTTDFMKSNAVDGVPVYKKSDDGSFEGDIVGMDKDIIQLVDGRKVLQASNHVYALVTLPGMVTPTVDLRYCDGPLSAYQTASMYSIQTRDVVKGVIGFEEPAEITNGDMEPSCEELQRFTIGEINEARAAQKKAMQNAGVASMDSRLSFTSPSPVYPDMVAIPLMSMERCYGPWLSNASIDPGTLSPGVTNIGGKIEFVKDENLVPWNFGGYQLMNDAGYLQAQFSNSLLLFSERGGFAIPQAPTGIGLAKALKLGGPLVTSIDVTISASEVSTTVRMDLYTSSFGKLQKQKEGAIAQVVRERQKLTDQRNNAIRRGLGKALSNKNLYEAVLQGGGQEFLDRAKQAGQHFSDFEKGKMEQSNLFVQASTSWNNGKPHDLTGELINIGEDAATGAYDLIKRGYSTIQTNAQQYAEMQALAEDVVDFAIDAGEVATGHIGDFITLVTGRGDGNQNVPAVPEPPVKKPEDRRGPPE